MRRAAAGRIVPPRKAAPRGVIVPLELEAVCLKAMARDRHKRYQTVADLLRDIRNYLDGYPVGVYSPTPLYGAADLGRLFRLHAFFEPVAEQFADQSRRVQLYAGEKLQRARAADVQSAARAVGGRPQQRAGAGARKRTVPADRRAGERLQLGAGVHQPRHGIRIARVGGQPDVPRHLQVQFEFLPEG